MLLFITLWLVAGFLSFWIAVIFDDIIERNNGYTITNLLSLITLTTVMGLISLLYITIYIVSYYIGKKPFFNKNLLSYGFTRRWLNKIKKYINY